MMAATTHQGSKVHQVTTSLSEFDKPQLSDLTVEVGGRKIYVHKAYLKVASDYLRVMLSDRWCHRSVVQIDHYPYEVIYEYFKFLYGGELAIDEENLEIFYDLAHYYLEENLKKHCMQYMLREVNPENLALYYELSLLYSDECLRVGLENVCKVRLGEMYPSAVRAKLSPMITCLEQYMICHVSYANADTVWRLAIQFDLPLVRRATQKFFEADLKANIYRPVYYDNRWSMTYCQYYQLSHDNQLDSVRELTTEKISDQIKNCLDELGFDHLNSNLQNQLLHEVFDNLLTKLSPSFSSSLSSH